MASVLLIRHINKFHIGKAMPLLALTRSHGLINVNNSFYIPIASSFKTVKRFESAGPPNDKKLTTKEKLKKAIAEYGSTVIIFHVSISLLSLGASYALVSSGLDVHTLMAPMGISDETAGKIAANAGTFAVAYAVHKVFAPVRITITLTATPFIVRYLRNIGILKKPI